eukprot:346120_1
MPSADHESNAIAKWLSLDSHKRVNKLVSIITDNPDLLNQNPKIFDQFDKATFAHMVTIISEDKNQKAMKTLLKFILNNGAGTNESESLPEDVMLKKMVKSMVSCKAYGQTGLLENALG